MRHSRPGVRLIAAALLLNAFVAGLIAFTLDHTHRLETEKAGLMADNMSRVLEENVSRFIDKIDLLLLATIDEIARQERAGGIDRAQLEGFLERNDARLPEVLGIRVSNAAGRVEYAFSNVIHAGADISQHEHFKRLRDDPSVGLFISKPLVGRLNPQPLIVLARRIPGPGGAFRGIVHVAVPLSTFYTMFSNIDLGVNGNVGLWDDGPMLIARFSPATGPSTGATTPSPQLRELIAGNHGPTAYFARSGVDQIERLFFFRRVGEWPLYAVVGVAPADFLESWRVERSFLIALESLFLIASIIVVAVHRRALMALEASRAEAHAAHRRSALLLSSAAEGICGIDRHGGLMFMNDAGRRMLGWSTGELPLGGFHQLTHHHHADNSLFPVEDCPLHRMTTGQTAGPEHVADDVYWRLDGSSFPVEYTLSPIVEGGQVVGVVNVFRDISERKEAERRLHFINRSLRLLNNIAAIPHGSTADRLKQALRLGCQHFGLELGIISRVCGDEYVVEHCAAPLDHPLRDGDRFDFAQTYCEITLRARDVVQIGHMGHSPYAGHPCYAAFQLESYIGVPLLVEGEPFGTINFSSTIPFGRPFDDADREFMLLLARWVGMILGDARTRDQLERLATTDPLTGAANRRKFMESAGAELDRARRYGRHFAVLMLDIDRFKGINDRYGHGLGDQVIVAVASAIAANLRDTDLVGRIGGEEFAVLLVETDERGAAELAERIRRRIEELVIAADGQQVRFTVSLGVAAAQGQDGVERILQRADQALYRAKNGGRNRVVCDCGALSVA